MSSVPSLELQHFLTVKHLCGNGKQPGDIFICFATSKTKSTVHEECLKWPSGYHKFTSNQSLSPLYRFKPPIGNVEFCCNIKPSVEQDAKTKL